MDGQAIIAVSAAVVALTQIIKWSPIPTGGWIPIVLVFAFAAIGVALWAISTEPAFDRHLLFSYFSGWIVVATAACGVFGLAQTNPRAAGGG